jgi:hypothetical protein
MNRFMANLKREAEENPIVALGVGAALITAIGKLIDAGVDASNARSWKIEVARRAMKDAQK